MIAALWSRSKHLSARLNKKGDERRDRRREREIKGAVEREEGCVRGGVGKREYALRIWGEEVWVTKREGEKIA